MASTGIITFIQKYVMSLILIHKIKVAKGPVRMMKYVKEFYQLIFSRMLPFIKIHNATYKVIFVIKYNKKYPNILYGKPQK